MAFVREPCSLGGNTRTVTPGLLPAVPPLVVCSPARSAPRKTLPLQDDPGECTPDAAKMLPSEQTASDELGQCWTASSRSVLVSGS